MTDTETKQADDDKKAMAQWDAVVGALLNDIQYHREEAVKAFNGIVTSSHVFHVNVMHRAAKTLATFISPSDD